MYNLCLYCLCEILIIIFSFKYLIKYLAPYVLLILNKIEFHFSLIYFNIKQNKMPTISFSIGGEQHDITGLTGDEVVDMIKTNYRNEAEMATCQEDCENKLNMTETELIRHIRNGGDDRCEECQAEAEAEIANIAYTSPYMRGEIEEDKTTPIKKEIDLNFAINVYDEVKPCDKNKLDEELHSAWLIELETDIEELIQERIRENLCVNTGDFDGDIVINDTGY